MQFMARFLAALLSIVLAQNVYADEASHRKVTKEFLSADTHVHGHGCHGQGRGPDELLSLLKPALLDIAAILVWGAGYEDDVVYFTGKDDPASTADHILHYDLEVSAFKPSDIMGHQIVLGLSSIDFPRLVSSIPVTDWAHAQGALSGFAHINAWPSPQRKLYPGFEDTSDLAPLEVPIRAALGTLDFLEIEHAVFFKEGNIWYKLLNTGFKIPIVGGSDWPCMSEGPGSVRTLFSKNVGKFDR